MIMQEKEALEIVAIASNTKASRSVCLIVFDHTGSDTGKIDLY